MSSAIIAIIDINDSKYMELPMPSLLIRDINEPTKKQLAIRAAQNGRSQQAEALAILENELNDASSTWVGTLNDLFSETGGIDLPISSRHTPRITGVML